MKIFKISFLSLSLAVIISSCSKQLDLSPTDSFIDATAFRTIADAQQGVNEAYLRYGSFYTINPTTKAITYFTSAYSNTMFQSALVSDEAKLGKDNSGQGALTYRYQYSSDATSGGDVTSTYSNYYFLVDYNCYFD